MDILKKKKIDGKTANGSLLILISATLIILINLM